MGESFIINHPFVDGNKRIAFLALFTILQESGIQLIAQEDDLYDFVIKMSTGATRFEEIVEWLYAHTALRK